jgi:DNA-binding XRE family transcriptional regulator
MNKKKKGIPSSIKGRSFEAFKKEAFKDEAFKKEYEALKPEFELLDQFIRARIKAKLSQAKLAKNLKAQQPAIARLERGGYANTSINNLTKVADAMGYSLHISLRAKKKVV